MQIMSGMYAQNLNFSPARSASPIIRPNSDAESQYLNELLAERQKLIPFMQVLPICSRLLNQEILRISGMIDQQNFGGDYERLLRGSPSHMPSPSHLPPLDIAQNAAAKGLGAFPNSPLLEPWMGRPEGMTIDWQQSGGSPSSHPVRRVVRMDIPVERYPTFNFVGRLLGPRGNSLKRVEISTGCRVFIRGKGSIKDPEKEESLRGRQGYEHLSEPLHILIEAELPVNIVDIRLAQAKEILDELLRPVDESQDLYKRQQLRELAMLNNSFKEESPQRGSVSPFSSSGLIGMKRAKTGWS